MGKHFEKKSKKKDILYKIFILIFIGVLVYNAYSLTHWYVDKTHNSKEIEEIEQIADIQEVPDSKNTELVNPPNDKDNNYWNYVKMPLTNVNIEELKQINNDTVGFLSVSRYKYQLSSCSNKQ